MHRLLRGWSGLLAFGLISTSAAAWTPETRIQMVDEAVRFMPESLRTALARHREELLRGMLEPLTDEDRPDHRAPWSGGRLDLEIERQMNQLQETLRTPGASFRGLSRDFGRLAHYMADAGFPPGVGRTDATERYRHFSDFCQERRPKFPLVFYGHSDPDLDRGDRRGFAARLMREAGEDDQRLEAAYARAGNPPAASAFDDRSLPFAVGSLSYSRSITSIVRAWISIWSSAQGDMGRTPYWNLNPPDSR